VAITALESKTMKSLLPSILVIAAIIGVTIGTKVLLEKYAPEAETKARVNIVPVVKTATVVGGEFEIVLTSEGVVETRRDTILSAQVGGRIEWVDPGFEVGAVYAKDTVIARIDELDYRTAVSQAESVLAQAELALVQEIARAEQAARDWRKIGGDTPPTSLVLREPFVRSAKANRDAAEAGLAKAEEDLARTEIKAPFDCRVRTVNLNVGATVAPGGQLGTIYDPTGLLIRLPYSLADFDRIPKQPAIILHTVINGTRHEWEAEMLWDLGEVDRETLSAYVLARVLPKKEEGRFQLPPSGVFLKADLKGAVLTNVVKVPSAAIRGQNEVFLLGGDNCLKRRKLTIVRRSVDHVFAMEGITGDGKQGIRAGEKVITNRIELPIEGMELREESKDEPVID
jgi:RND family efflux transporter MFP subunit